MQIFTDQCAVIGDPALMKRVLQTNLKNYGKDLEFSYSPFIVRRSADVGCAAARLTRQACPPAQDILGTGLVTSEGALWNKQRTLISYALRVEILDDIVGIALRAVERLVRLPVRGSQASAERGARTRAVCEAGKGAGHQAVHRDF